MGAMNLLQRWAVRRLGLDDLYTEFLRGGLEDDMTDSGPEWREEYRRAMSHPDRSSITMDCIDFLRDLTVALPLVLERRTGEEDWQEVKTGSGMELVKMLRRTMAATLRAIGLWGNAYWRMRLTNGGRPLEMKYLHPGCIKPKLMDGEIVSYEFTPPNGRLEMIPAEEVLHIRWDADQTFPTSPTPLLPVVRYVNLDAAATIFSKVGIDNGPGGLLVQLMGGKNGEPPGVSGRGIRGV